MEAFAKVAGYLGKLVSPPSILVACLALSAFSTTTSHAASFDCRRVGNGVENAICRDPKLSALDSELALAYKKAMTTGIDPYQLQYDQRVWISERNQCRTVQCLYDIYNRRLREIHSEADVVANACERTPTLEVPSQDLPSTSDIMRLRNCNPTEYYYGIKAETDYITARKCALIRLSQQRSEEIDDDYGMSPAAILMMIYANGYGVSTNYDLAEKFVCSEGSTSASAEVFGRIKHLEALRAKRPNQQLQECLNTDQSVPEHSKDYCAGIFDYCDDVTSGRAAGQCAGIEAAKADQDRNRKLIALTANWTEDQKKAFEGLSQKANDFFEASSRGEVDMSGTARGAAYEDALTTLKEQFFALVSNIEGNRGNLVASSNAASVDAELDRAYQRAVSINLYGTITKEGISDAQKSWQAYRAAWLGFVAIRYPNIPQQVADAWITESRIKKLQELVSGGD